MNENCKLEDLNERKFSKKDLSINDCKECLFNILCLDYTHHDEKEYENAMIDAFESKTNSY